MAWKRVWHSSDTSVSDFCSLSPQKAAQLNRVINNNKTAWLAKLNVHSTAVCRWGCWGCRGDVCAGSLVFAEFFSSQDCVVVFRVTFPCTPALWAVFSP